MILLMNKLDKQYTDLLQDILDNGVVKETRNGGTISVFGKQIRHKMSDGFPLLTTKKMAWKSIVTELLWFLRGDTNIKFLVDNDCHIWDGDAYKNYLHKVIRDKDIVGYLKSYSIDTKGVPTIEPYSKDEFIERIKNDDEFAKKWGELGPVYGKQWRQWQAWMEYENDGVKNQGSLWYDQIGILIHELKTKPDSRRLIVNSWNVGDLDKMALPPCHYSFQIYTRELSRKEKIEYLFTHCYETGMERQIVESSWTDENFHDKYFNVPKRAISLMWNQRSVDTFLGLPFNIASYGLLLEIIAKSVNMVPDELIGNLGDVHLYSNHVEQAKEQIGRELSREEKLVLIDQPDQMLVIYFNENPDKLEEFLIKPIRTRQPYKLPTLNINTEFWPTKGGSCGEGPLDAIAVFNSFKDDNFCKCLLEEDIQLANYQSHPTIKAPLSN